MNSPLFSIGIASYNNAHYLGPLLDSIAAQTYPNLEVIVVDDASKDDSVAVAEAWGSRTGIALQVVRHARNRGMVPTFNECRQRAAGEYISLIGSDDLLDPDYVAATVAEFERRGPECGVVYSDCRVIDAAGELVSPSFLNYFDPAFAASPPEGNLIVPLLSGFYLPALTAAVRRTSLDAVGLHDESLFSEDLDMWLRLSRQYQFAYLPQVLGAYRVHSRSAVSTNRLALNETYFAIYRKGYFNGPAEWAAARRNLANHAEHYYANGGDDAPAKLWYALRETRRPKLLAFYLLSLLKVDYHWFRQFISGKPTLA